MKSLKNNIENVVARMRCLQITSRDLITNNPHMINHGIIANQLHMELFYSVIMPNKKIKDMAYSVFGNTDYVIFVSDFKK